MLFSVCFHCIVLRKMPGQLQKYQVLVTFAGFSIALTTSDQQSDGGGW